MTAVLLIQRDTPGDEAILSNRLEEILDPILKDRFGVFNHVSEVKRLAYSHRKNRPPNIVAGVDEEEIIIKDVRISKRMLQSVYRNLLNEVEEVQGRLLLGASGTFDIEKVFDDVSRTSRGTKIEPSKDPHDCALARGRILRRIEDDEELCRVWCSADPVSLNARPSILYLERYAKYMELLVCLIHIGGGMPGRGTELPQYRICDVDGNDRSVYFLDGHVYLFARYNKSSATTDDCRPIARFLDRRLSEVVLRDLFYIRPWVILLATTFQRNPGNVYNSELLVRVGEKMSDIHIRRAFEASFLRASGTHLHFSTYRHVAKYFAVLGKIPDLVKSEDVKILHDQAGHSSSTANRHYAISTSEHVDLRSDRLFTMRSCSFMWHKFLKGALNLSISQPAPPALEPSSPPLLDLAPLSRLSSAPEASPGTAAVSSLNINFVSEKNSANTLAELRRLCGDEEATFKSDCQHTLFDYSLWTSEDIIGVLPTGGGKSLAFFLYASAFPEKRIVVIVPTVALQEDLKRRAEHFQISCCDQSHFYNDERILLLVTDDLLQISTRMLLRRLCGLPSFGKFFVDEVHTFGTDYNYRPSMRELSLLPGLGTVVAVTATCSPAVMRDLKSNLFGPNHPPLVIRQDTARKNLKYFAVRLEDPKHGITTIRSSLIDLPMDERIIVFCLSIKEAEDMSVKLNCALYHSDLSYEDRAIQSQNWKTGVKKCMAATSGYGLGVDYAKVRIVYLWGTPYDIDSLVQQSGRAGRDGQSSSVVVFHGPAFDIIRDCLVSRHGPRAEAAKYAAMFVSLKTCRRRFLARYFEEQELSCSALGSEKCDNCFVTVERQNNQMDFHLAHIQIPIVLPSSGNAEQIKANVLQEPVRSNSRKRSRSFDDVSFDLAAFKAQLKIYADKFAITEDGRQQCVLCFLVEGITTTHEIYFKCRHLANKCVICASGQYSRSHLCARNNLIPKASRPLCIFCSFPRYVHDSSTGLYTNSCKLRNTIEYFQAYMIYQDSNARNLISEEDEDTKLPKILTEFVERCAEKEDLLLGFNRKNHLRKI